MLSVYGNVMSVGIIEFDEDWFPFCFDSPSNPYESEEDDEEDEESEGVSETCVQ